MGASCDGGRSGDNARLVDGSSKGGGEGSFSNDIGLVWILDRVAMLWIMVMTCLDSFIASINRSYPER